MKLCPDCQSLCPAEASTCPECGAKVSPSELKDADKLVGMQLGGKYELVEYLGEGAMGWVYRGVHQTLHNSVAVKIMKPEFRPDPSRAERFRLEAQAASRLNHPHIISVIDFGETPTGLLYIVTEYLRGVSLGALIAKEAPFELKRAYRIMGQILSALEESHNAGVIHRDLKPDNIMVSTLRGGEEFIKILDFGIAKLADRAPGTSLTQAGQIFGTPDYMAPEQIRSQEVSPATDLYAAGVILFEMLTGRLPFVQESLFDILKDHLYTKPPSLTEANPKGAYDEALEAVVAKALAKDPKERFQSAREFKRVLRRAFRLATGKVRKCPTCGAYVKQGVRFCPECGFRISGEQVATARSTSGTLAGATASQMALSRLWANRRIELPFVGRADQLAHIDGLLEGRVHTLLLVGEPGSGKSTLGFKALRAAMRRGLAVLTIGPHHSLLPVSWHPIRFAVRRVLGLPERVGIQELERLLEEHPDLRQDAAGLAKLLGLPGPLDDAPQKTQRRELTAAALHVLSWKWKGLLFFDEVDQYDMASVDLLVRLASRRDRASKLLLATAVPLLAEAPGRAVSHLEPLSADERRELIQKLARNEKGSWTNYLEQVAERTGGNPFWLEQQLLLLAESGTETTQGLTDIIATRMSRLPASAMEVLQALAVLGLEASLESVQFLLGGRIVPEPTLELLAHRSYVATIRAESTAATVSHRLRFRHPLYAQVLRESMPRDIRRSLNERAAQLALQQERPQVVHAHHLLQAEDYEKAVDALERAGREAFECCDPASAAALFRRAAETARWELLLAEEDDLTTRLNRALAESLELVGDRAGALAVYKYLASFLDVKPKERISVQYRVARLEAALGRPARAIQLVRSAVGEALLLDDVELLGQGYSLLADLLLQSGDAEAAAAELEEAMSILVPTEASRLPKGVPSVWELAVRYALLQARAAPARALHIVNQALAAAAEDGRRPAQAKGLLARAHCEHCLGRREEARQTLEQALAIYRGLGDRQGQALALAHRARLESNGSTEGYKAAARRLLASLEAEDIPLEHLLSPKNTAEFLRVETSLA